MPTLTENATSLAMALAVKHISKEPMLADAEALLTGRPHLWLGWDTALPSVRRQIIQLIQYRPYDLNFSGNFIGQATKLLQSGKCPFRAAESSPSLDTQNLVKLSEKDFYCLKPGFDLDGLIDELLSAVTQEPVAATSAAVPSEGPLKLREHTPDGYRTFVIPQVLRPRLDAPGTKLSLRESPYTASHRWDWQALHDIAARLDAAASEPRSKLHPSHRTSLANIVGKDRSIEAAAGSFYRVNAPTGSGKSVAMNLMALASAAAGRRVVIAVPTLTDVRNTVETLKLEANVVASHLQIAPLHSQRKIAKAGAHYEAMGRDDHPYDYRCLLDYCATDGSVSKADDEPCFNLQITLSDAGQETTKRLRSCPLLAQCGKRQMLEQALAADIVVVNHHALISSTTRIPVEGDGAATRSILELLLRSSPLFLVDEIDGLLQSAIDTSKFELPLSNHSEHSSLAELYLSIFGKDSIPDLDASVLFRVQRACPAVIMNTTRLLSLARKSLQWPNRETVWERADDLFISESLGVSADNLDAVCGFNDEPIAPHLLQLQTLLRTFSRNNPQPGPEEVYLNIGGVLDHLVKAKQLGRHLNDEKLKRLKAALILRASLHYIEESLRTLYADIPAMVRAKVPAAVKVQQDLAGSAPFSPTPLGPLQRVVYGFKRKRTGRDTWSLQVVAMCGDPHRTLQFLPNLTSQIYANVDRTFIGFSATAYFPGASSFDLKAKTLVDVPDVKGNIRFENVQVSVHVSGTDIENRLENVRHLGHEIWPWLTARLAALRQRNETSERARLLLVTGSDAEAEELASTLYEISGGARRVGWIRGGKKADRQDRLPRTHRLTYDDLVDYANGAIAGVELLVSSIYPMARGHNIVTSEGKSALGGVVVCVRPMPSSDQPGNNLAHLCYIVGDRVQPNLSPGLALLEERALANRTLNEIRTSPPYFSRQPKAIRHFTIMNVLVTLTQLVGRARRGGTPVTCYLADAAFFDNRTTWAQLLGSTIGTLEEAGHWQEFSRHHAGLVEAMNLYIEQAKPEPNLRYHDDPPVAD
jgi:energy-coupling factor transporter ATP-binding protein EcfA2